jgi:hypothetical protein
MAVEFWTRGAYSTADIDLYLPHGPAVLQLLGPLGFERRGRHYVIEEERLRPALRAIEAIAERVRAGDAIESWELHETARKLRTRGVD